jgi:DNA invertase Pin-like site-specific DNA recombinase
MQKNQEKREQIKEMLRQGNNQREIAKKLKTSPNIVSECSKELKQVLELESKQ